MCGLTTGKQFFFLFLHCVKITVIPVRRINKGGDPSRRVSTATPVTLVVGGEFLRSMCVLVIGSAVGPHTEQH